MVFWVKIHVLSAFYFTVLTGLYLSPYMYLRKILLQFSSKFANNLAIFLQKLGNFAISLHDDDRGSLSSGHINLDNKSSRTTHWFQTV